MDTRVEFNGPKGSAHGSGDQGLGTALSLLVDELAYGLVIAARDARVAYANHAARHELSRRRVLFSTGGTLSARISDDTRALQDALVRAVDGKRCLLTLSAIEGAHLVLAVLPLRGDATTPARAALVFARPSVCESLMLGFFARSHGLTPTEEAVLGILCQGYSAPEAASQLRVAVSTVRSHVRSLCVKTRTNGVRELVNRVAVLPPVAPALWHEPVH